MHPHSCNFSPYYVSQAGSGLAIYKGQAHQRGYGLFSNVFRRFGFPILKYLAKPLFGLTKQVGEDIFVHNQDPKESIKRQLKRTAKEVALDALDRTTSRVSQIGTGKRRKVSKRKTSSKRKPAKQSRKVAKRKSTRVRVTRLSSTPDIFG